MKKTKLLLSIAALSLLCAGTVMAYDATANIRMTGSLVSVEKDGDGIFTTDILTNNPTNQIDNPGDGIEIDFDAGIAGAHIGLWYKTATNGDGDANLLDDWSAYFRRTYVWISPIDILKIRVGYIGTESFFKERIDQWKVGSPFSIASRNWTAHPMYINCNDVEGWGFGLELRPIEQLAINAGISPAKKGGYINGTVPSIRISSDSEDVLVAPWGIGARYWLDKFEFQASYRSGIASDTDDLGTLKDTWSVARLAVGYTDSSVYAFFQPILGFDYDTDSNALKPTGLCLDLYGEYYFDAWTFMLHSPVTFRFTGDANDVSYLEWIAQVKYNLGSFGNVDDLTPYVKFGSSWDDVGISTAYRVWRFDDTFGDYFNMSFAPGLNLKVANCVVDVAVQYDMYSTKYKNQMNKDWNISVPFSMKLSF